MEAAEGTERTFSVGKMVKIDRVAMGSLRLRSEGIYFRGTQRKISARDAGLQDTRFNPPGDILDLLR